MNLLLQWSPSDTILQAVGLLSLGVGLLIGLATVLATLTLRRRPAGRHALWLATLICVALLPFVLIGVDQIGCTWSMQRPVLLDRFAPAALEPRILPSPERPAIDLAVHNASVEDLSNATSASLPAATEVSVPTASAKTEAGWTAMEWLRAFATMGMLIWVAGTAALSIRLWHGARQVTRLRTTVQQVHNRRLDESLQIAATILRMKRLPAIVASADSTGPVVVGLFKPIVVLPLEFVRTATVDQLTDVLVHECAHVVRHDVWVGLVQRLVQVAFWPHPLIYWMNRQLSQSREEVCDNYVLRRGDGAGYAQTLLELAERYSSKMHPAATLAIINPRWRLEDRIAGLLDPHRNSATQVGRVAFVVMTIALLACGGTIAAARLQVPASGDAVVVDQPADPQPPADNSERKSIPVRESHIEAGLQSATIVSFMDCPLQDALNYLEDLHNIDIQLDLKSLERRNIPPDTSVSLVATGIPLRSALQLILEPLSLTTKIENGELVVTSRVNTMLSLRELSRLDFDPPVADIVRFGIKPAELIAGVAAVIEPASWKSNGGQGTMEVKTIALPDAKSAEAFIARQRLEILFEVEDLLDEVKRAIRDPQEVADDQKVESRDYSLKTLHEFEYSDVRILQVLGSMCHFDAADDDDKPQRRMARIEGDQLTVTQTKQVQQLLSDMFNRIDRPRDVRRADMVRLHFEGNSIRWQLGPQYIREALSQPVSVAFEKNPLDDALRYLRDITHIGIHVSSSVTNRENLFATNLQSYAVRQPMSQVLDKLLQPAGLGWYVIYPEMIVVTTKEDAAQHLEVRAYRIKELLPRGQTTAGLLQQIQRIEPETWSARGGLGRIHALPGVLLVNQTYHVHDEITQLLTEQK